MKNNFKVTQIHEDRMVMIYLNHSNRPNFYSCMPAKKVRHDTWIMFKPWTMKEFETPPQVIRGPILRSKITRVKGFPCFQGLVEYGAPVVTFPLGRRSPTNELTWRPKKPYNN